MSCVIIADGLTNKYLGEDVFFEERAQHVGSRERDRLLGAGNDAGSGPLCQILDAATKEQGVHTILLREDGTGDLENSCALPIALQRYAEAALELKTDGHLIPGEQLSEAIGETASASVLIVGTHTERRIYAIASYLKNVVGIASVAVCPHLTGSSSREAYLATFRHGFPVAGVEVLLDLQGAATYLGLSEPAMADTKVGACAIEPSEIREAIADEQRRIVQLLCMHWDVAQLRPLSGGFSGSLLFIATGQKGLAKTEPLVLKIDSFSQMRRELEGYYRVKDFLGKHVPTFGLPVALGEHIGVAMELAAMEGSPETMQESFESADSERMLEQFNRRFDKTLSLLVAKLYRNTAATSWVIPYRQLGLHTKLQQEWLLENAQYVSGYLEEAGVGGASIDAEQLQEVLQVVSSNEDGLQSDACLVHGDLNLANVICDGGDNVWYIDWTHCGMASVELDFAKLENDIKFVMSKDFDIEDLPRLRKFEEFLLAHRIPPDVDELPESLKFAKWDLRFRKILGTVRRVRTACFSLKEDNSWLVYQIALLRYALHTLSFDARRDRGECDATQLALALYSVEALLYALIADDFHLKIRAAKPSSYPPRQRISIDESHWLLECDGYAPPYYVDKSVLAADSSEADPEDFDQVGERAEIRETRFKSDAGLPQNPRGRTGIAGRGLLGLWGPNPSVAVILVRPSTDKSGLEVLAGQSEENNQLRLPRGLVASGEDNAEAAARMVTQVSGLVTRGMNSEQLSSGYSYDMRQTDNAWVVLTSYLLFTNERNETPPALDEVFTELKYHRLSPAIINKMSGADAEQVRTALPQLIEMGMMSSEDAEQFMSATG